MVQIGNVPSPVNFAKIRLYEENGPKPLVFRSDGYRIERLQASLSESGCKSLFRSANPSNRIRRDPWPLGLQIASTVGCRGQHLPECRQDRRTGLSRS